MTSTCKLPHLFVRGKFQRVGGVGPWPEETCGVCGHDPRNILHISGGTATVLVEIARTALEMRTESKAKQSLEDEDITPHDSPELDAWLDRYSAACQRVNVAIAAHDAALAKVSL